MPDKVKSETEKPLYSPAVVADVLNRHGLRADKNFGQNFLIDGNVLKNIVAAAEVRNGDTVLEIGPGLGVLTRALAEAAGHVVSVELDARLLPVLQETTGHLDNITVIHGDGLEYDLTQLPPNSLLVANLPYNVATPILVRALESGRFKRVVVMVQKEVAERLKAAPGDPAFGALSLVVQHFASVKTVKDVKPDSFYPAPAVTSSVVRLEVDPEAQADAALFDLVHTAFRHRRKTLKKNLLMAGYDKQIVVAALQAANLDPRVRAEALGLGVFAELQNTLMSGTNLD